MEGFYRIAAATPRLHLGDPASNVKELVRLAKDAAKDGVSAIVFPELCLTGYTCGDMFFRDELLTAANAATETYAIKTANLPIVSIVGLPVAEGPAIYNAAAVVHGGKIAGIVRKRALPNYGEYYERRQFTPVPADEPLYIFDVRGFRFGVEICEDLWTPVPPSSLMAESGVDVVFNLSASTDFLGKSQKRQSLVEQQSLRLGCAYAMACAGSGESSSDAVYGGCPVIAVEGRTVATGKLFNGAPQIITADVDVAAARHRRRSTSSVYCSHSVPGVHRQLVTLTTAGGGSYSTSNRLDSRGGWQAPPSDDSSSACPAARTPRSHFWALRRRSTSWGLSVTTSSPSSCQASAQRRPHRTGP